MNEVITEKIITPHTTRRIMMPCEYAIMEIPKQQKRTKDKKAEFIICYIDACATVAKACRMAGISRWTFYNWRKNDPVFRSKLNRCFDESMKNLTESNKTAHY